MGKSAEFEGYKLAGWWKRVAAHLMDVLPFSLPLGGLAALLDAPILLILGLPLTLLIYCVLSCQRKGENNGQTFGKQLMKLKVMREDGQPVDLRYALHREIFVKVAVVGAVSFISLGILTGLNFLRPLWHPRKQAWHDQLVKSYVVDIRTPKQG